MSKLDITKIATKIMLIKNIGKPNQQEIGCGTGFFLNYPKQNNYKKFLCTNKHVARMISQYMCKENEAYKKKLMELDTELVNLDYVTTDKEELIEELREDLKDQREAFSKQRNVTLAFYLYDRNDKQREARLITCKEEDFIYDDEENYDIALLDITDAIKNIIDEDIEYIGKELFPSSDYIQNSMDIVEDLVVVGYPLKRYDWDSHLPIINKGSTATPYKCAYTSNAYLDEVEDDIGYDKNKIFIANVLGLPSQSGSPVLLYNKGYNSETRRIETEYKLLGILCAAWEDICINIEIDKCISKGTLQSFPTYLLHHQVTLCEVIKTEVIEKLLYKATNPMVEFVVEHEEAVDILNEQYGK